MVETDEQPAELERLKAELQLLRERYPEAPVVAAPALPRCPFCNIDMELGKASVRASLIGFLFGGLGYHHLWFAKQGAKDSEKAVIICSDSSTTAWRCPKCKAALMKTDKNAWTAH